MACTHALVQGILVQGNVCQFAALCFQSQMLANVKFALDL